MSGAAFCSPPGLLFDGILKTAKMSSADLIVMGSHRKQLLRDVFVGTTMASVMRISSYSVLMVNQAVDHPYEKVLLATDMSEVSAWAIRIGEALGMGDKANLTLVHAFRPWRPQDDPCGCERNSTNAHVDAERLTRKRRALRLHRSEPFSAEKWSRHVEPGTPFEVISRVVQEKMPDP